VNKYSEQTRTETHGDRATTGRSDSGGAEEGGGRATGAVHGEEVSATQDFIA